MSNEIVKYDPELNTIPLRKFTPVEMNLFFSIVSRDYSDIAQLVERLTVNQDVDGSSPPVGVIYGKPWRVVRVAEGAALEML